MEIVNSQTQPVPAQKTLPGAMAILKEAFSIYKNKQSVLLGIVAVPVLLDVMFNYLTGDISGVPTWLKTNSTAVIVGVAALIVVYAVVSLWGYLAVLSALRDDNLGVTGAYRAGRSKIFSSAWVSILTALIVMLGFLMFIIPGVIFSVWYSFAVFVLVFEDLRGMKALNRSREYVRGIWWKIFAKLLFVGMYAIVLSIVLSVLGFFMGRLFLGDTMPSMTVDVIYGLFVEPVFAIYLFLVYRYVKSFKEGISPVAPPQNII